MLVARTKPLRSRNTIGNKHGEASSAKIKSEIGRLAGFKNNECLPSAWALTQEWVLMDNMIIMICKTFMPAYLAHVFYTNGRLG